MKTLISFGNKDFAVVACGAFINYDNFGNKSVQVFLEFTDKDEHDEVFFDVDLSNTKFWNGSYGVEGSPVWVESNIADTMCLILTEDYEDDYDIDKDVMSYIIEQTYEDVQQRYLEVKAQQEGDY